MKFTVKDVESTGYKIVDLVEYFKGLKDYQQDGEDGIDFYNFHMLLEEEDRILFAIRNNFRADIYSLDLDTFQCTSLGDIGTNSPLEGDSLALRAIGMEKIDFEYRLDDEWIINGLYSLVDKKIIYEFKTPCDWDYLYLTDRYYIASKDSFHWNDEDELWIDNRNEDNLYLYDRVEDKSFEIWDERIKNSYHTSSNHFVKNYNDQEYLLNFPFTRDIEDAEEILKGEYKSEVLTEPKEISFIKLDKFAENVKNNKSIEFEVMYSWEKESAIKLYNHFNYTSKSLDFAIYDLKAKNMEVFKPIFSDKEIAVKSIAKADYSHLKSALNVTYVGKGMVLAYKDCETEILTPIRKSISHTNREHLVDYNEDGYLIDGWDEDEDGSNFIEYLIIKDRDGKELVKLEDYFLKLEYRDILIKI